MKNKRKLSYPGYIRIILAVVQTAAILVLAVCVHSILTWRQDWGGLREAAGDYLETSFFFRRVDEILDHKILGRQNLELFESDGEFDDLKEIDIQSYGLPNTNYQDLNTTYLVKDLLDFDRSGGRQELHEAIEKAVRDGNRNHPAGEILGDQWENLETILPVTDISLAECSKWYTNSTDFILEMYQKLDEVCESISSAYQAYTMLQDESWSEDAPSNLRYCILNKATGEIYTNLEVTTFEQAEKALPELPEFMPLFKGERSYNVMVADPDETYSEAALLWFQSERFVSTNEKVLLAVDPSFPVMDGLQTDSEQFSQLGSRLMACTAAAVLSLLVLVVCFLLSILSTGHLAPHQETRLYFVDRIPSELALAAYMFLLILFVVAFRRGPGPLGPYLTRYRIRLALIAAGYLVFLSGCTGLARRLQRKTLWSNSISCMLVHSWRQVTSTRLLSGRFLVIYITFFALNLLFLVIFGRAGVFLVLIMDIVALLYLLRDLVGKQSVWEGIHKISQGNLSYKIDVTPLQGDTYEMAKAINDMGDGLQEAVDSLLKNERLKAELITNVSHDLKTPLTSIVNYVDLLKKENPQGENVRKYIEILEQKSLRLKQLTEDLVEASRISSGNITLEMMRLPFEEILHQACGEFADRFDERHLKTVLSIDQEKPLWIMADGNQLWRVLENLMSNVCKYAKEGTDFSISLKRSAQDHRIVLEMKNETDQDLFVSDEDLTERFVRGDVSRHTEGSGLGLSIAKSLAELMGGTLQIHTQERQFLAVLSFEDAGQN